MPLPPPPKVSKARASGKSKAPAPRPAAPPAAPSPQLNPRHTTPQAAPAPAGVAVTAKKPPPAAVTSVSAPPAAPSAAPVAAPAKHVAPQGLGQPAPRASVAPSVATTAAARAPSAQDSVALRTTRFLAEAAYSLASGVAKCRARAAKSRPKKPRKLLVAERAAMQGAGKRGGLASLNAASASLLQAARVASSPTTARTTASTPDWKPSRSVVHEKRVMTIAALLGCHVRSMKQRDVANELKHQAAQRQAEEKAERQRLEGNQPKKPRKQPAAAPTVAKASDPDKARRAALRSIVDVSRVPRLFCASCGSPKLQSAGARPVTKSAETPSSSAKAKASAKHLTPGARRRLRRQAAQAAVGNVASTSKSSDGKKTHKRNAACSAWCARRALAASAERKGRTLPLATVADVLRPSRVLQHVRSLSDAGVR